MGIVRFGPPKDIILYIKEKYNCGIFIETGTFHGWTSFWASSQFKSVKTIEFSKEIYQETIKRHSNLVNVDFIFGDSRIELSNIISELKESAIFWLDAHWCSFGSYGEDDQCPLLDEIDIVTASTQKHVILIDDARLFLAPPPLPNITKYYPCISEITAKLFKKEYHTVIYEDVIFCIPKIYKVDFINFMQNKITIDDKLARERDIKLERIKKVKRTIKKIIGYKYWS